jgi:subtilisin family serine protease
LAAASLLFVLFPVREALFPVRAATASPPKAPHAPTSRFVQDRALVGVRPGQLASARASVRAIGGRVVSVGSQGSFLVVDTNGAVPGWVDSTRGRPGVRYAEPDYVATFDAVPNDPSYPSQWGLPTVGAPAAWDTTTGSSSVVVGVIDTGVQSTHEDLTSRMWTNPGEIPGNGIDDEGDGYIDDVHGIDCATGSGDPSDTNGHGTAVAGVIAAAGNNGLGVTGVAWDARIMSLRFTDASGAGTVSAAVRCIDYAIAHGAAITNDSWQIPYSQTLRDAIVRARNAGQLFIAAAGNTGTNSDTLLGVYPADYDLDNIISVTASDPTDALASFSTFGPLTVDLAAPGTDILSTAVGGNGYGTLSGTSLAAPFVSGAAALVLSAYPGSPYQQIVDRILGSVDVVPSLTGKVGTGGRLNVARALEADTVAPGATSLTVSNTSRTSLSLTWTAPAENGASGGTISRYALSYAPAGTGGWAAAPAPASSLPGTRQTTTIAGLVPGSPYDVSLSSVDNVGNRATATTSARTRPGILVLATDAENGSSGWTASGSWAITTEAGHSPTHAWSDSPAALSPLNANISLGSPAFSLVGVVAPRLSFWTRYQMTKGFQSGTVEASSNGGASWTKLGTYAGASAFRPIELNLSAFAGAPSVQVRFRMKSNSTQTLDGWYVDDMVVSGTDTTPPGAPQGLVATPGQGQVALDWTDNGEGDLASYAVYRTTDPPSGTRTWWKIATPTTSDLLDYGVVAGRPTYYKVTAVDTSSNEGPASTNVVATPSSAPAEYGPDSVVLSKGSSFGDPISAMAAADEGAVFRVGSVPGGSKQQTSVQISRTLPVGTPAVTRLNVVVEGSYSAPVTQTLFIKNWVTGSFDKVGASQPASSPDGVVGSSISNPSVYISSGRIVRVRVDSAGGSIAYTSSTDLVRFALWS